MEITELETLESKTKAILDTLEDLEKEVVEYQRKNESITYAFLNLSDASGQVASAGKGLSEAAEIFSGSDFATAMKAIDARIDHIREAEVLIQSQSKEISGIAEEVLAEYRKLDSNINSLIQSIREMLEVKQMIADLTASLDVIGSRIARIDQNTQKGFNKIKG
jgi:DNA repair exonuclease SbcCD ATPase subunit